MQLARENQAAVYHHVCLMHVGDLGKMSIQKVALSYSLNTIFIQYKEVLSTPVLERGLGKTMLSKVCYRESQYKVINGT